MVSAEKSDFEQVYRDYYTPVYRYVFKKINNSSTAEDITSDIFFKAFKCYSSYDSSKASVKTWLFKITENRLKNYYRDRKVTVDIDNEELASDSADSIMLDAASLQECRNTIADALNTLSERYRRAIVLKFFYNMSTSEIASELNTTAGNVRVISMRALQKLSEYFADRGFKPEDYI